jgi:hypothetical protein
MQQEMFNVMVNSVFSLRAQYPIETGLAVMVISGLLICAISNKNSLIIMVNSGLLLSLRSVQWDKVLVSLVNSAYLLLYMHSV